MKVKDTITKVMKQIAQIEKKKEEQHKKLKILDARRGTMTGGRKIG